MTIRRIIDGREHEIELTGEEMTQAYFVQQHEFDKSDIEGVLEDYIEMLRDEGRTQTTLDEFLEDDELMNRAALILRKSLEYSDDGWTALAEDAIDEALRARGLLKTSA